MTPKIKTYTSFFWKFKVFLLSTQQAVDSGRRRREILLIMELWRSRKKWRQYGEQGYSRSSRRSFVRISLVTEVKRQSSCFQYSCLQRKKVDWHNSEIMVVNSSLCRQNTFLSSGAMSIKRSKYCQTSMATCWSSLQISWPKFIRLFTKTCLKHCFVANLDIDLQN